MGVDGSDAAIKAALWAIDEAISRDVPLRIVHVIHIAEETVSAGDDFRLELQYAEASLRAASAAVEATGKAVKVETEILWGPVNPSLIDESRNAAMLCVGSTGIGAVARTLFGSTAATLAEDAYCPVAVIRTGETPPDPSDWIVVAVEDAAGNEAVGELAMQEARIRHAPVLAVGVRRRGVGKIACDELDRRVEDWQQSYPDVDIFRVAADVGIDRFVAETKDDKAQLAVIGGAEARRITQIVGPHGHSLVPHGECSVLVAH
ncbi:universal stress protein [Mycobacterium sp. 2YAF39]|uniref:universal stress protein n=1 Tax=Mycobacterium sp. 2YAF39 TaxID=3233033 RepID=UPI003F95AB94